MASEHEFCRLLLKQVMKEVKKAVPDAQERKKAWAYNYKNGQVEFHFGEFYWNGRGCCTWEAKAKGWEAYLGSIKQER